MDSIENRINYLKNLAVKGGPDPEMYEELLMWMNDTGSLIESGYFSVEDVKKFYSNISELFPVTCIQGQTYHKPYGYPGDFELLDRIYTNYISPDPDYTKWDCYFHSCSAPNAVRYRKELFKSILKEKSQAYQGKCRVLNIASGPCRDVKEFFDENPCSTIEIDCLEHDERAISYAKNLCHNHNHKINFIKGNIMRFKFEKEYDLVWSGGLFDYFNDDLFSRILNYILCNTANNGEIILGNFSVTNPSKFYMLLFDWNIHHRTPEQLKAFALKCGVEESNISVNLENEKVNLFLHIKNTQ